MFQAWFLEQLNIGGFPIEGVTEQTTKILFGMFFHPWKIAAYCGADQDVTNIRPFTVSRIYRQG